MTTSLTKRAGPLFGVVLVVGALLAAVTPTVPAALALDPTPAPSAGEPQPEATATPAPSAEPTPGSTPESTAEPTTEPTAEPTAAPTEAPSGDPAGTPSPGETPGATPAPDPSASAEPTPLPTPVPGGVGVGHAWVEVTNEKGRVASAGEPDTGLTDAARFTVYRVRFQVVNDGDEPVTIDPTLELRDGDQWRVVPEVDPLPGRPFYAAADDGKRFRARREPIAADELRLAAAEGLTAVDGASSAGENPMRDLRLPPHAVTEVEFAIRATMDAAWDTAYELRLADGRRELAGAGRVPVTMGAKPAVELSPGQRDGRGVKDAVPVYRLQGDAMTATGTAAGSDLPNAGVLPLGRTAAYPLTGPTAAQAGGFTSPHTDYTLTTDACASCHASHTAQSNLLLREPAPQATGCLTCHDGTGALSAVQGDWTSPTVPANDPATSSWYSHPATEDSALAHVNDRDDEFGATLNRHAACADCHQPHLSDATQPLNSVGGWGASGAIKGASGVAVVNGPAGSAPTYTLRMTSTFEYELCLKCHSGYTQLPAQDPDHPSRWALDKGVELNPANVSYHPVEAPGRNQTAAMALSLAGSSPYKLWNFETDETVRCLNCHGDSSKAIPASPPAADARLDNHASPNRGILIAAYRDRTLKPTGQAYQAGDFALCYTCHAEEPMVDDSGDVRFDTNFNWHGFHLNATAHDGTGTLDIDVPGAGQGNATCAECHFRTHGTALAVNGQVPAKGLVNFGPNVQPFNGQLEFRPATPTTLGTCTLTCHGKPHDGYVYAAAP